MIYFLLAIYSAVFMSFIQVAGECFPVKNHFYSVFRSVIFVKRHLLSIISFPFFLSFF